MLNPSKVLLRIVGNMIALYFAAYFVEGFNLEISLLNLFLAGTILGVINIFLRPILKILSLPLIILTLGLFIVIINILMLYLVAFIFPFFHLAGFWAAFWGVLIIGLVNYLLESWAKDRKKTRRHR